jgi:hypothetical protein
MTWLWLIGGLDDRTEMLRLLDDLLDDMGSPPLLEAVRCSMHGYLELFSVDSADSLHDCVAWFERARETASRHGLTTTELTARYGLSLAVARRRDSDASARIAATPNRYSEVGMFINLDVAVEATALVLADSGNLDAAAVVIGYLEQFHSRAANHPLASLRSNLVERVGPITNPSSFRGASMGRFALIEFALSQLQLEA